MAEDTKEPETTETAEEAAPVVTKIYVLQSTVRGRHNRTKRASVPGRQPFVQRIAGGRILVRRARPARITEAVLLAHLDEIKLAVARHQLVVTTNDGKPVDLETLTAGAPAAAASPRPNPPLDSAKNDPNENVGYNVPGAPEGTTLDADVPEILQQVSPLDDTNQVDVNDWAGEIEDETAAEADEKEPATVPTADPAPPKKPAVPAPPPRGKRGRS
jgi:hypothetical protein